LADLADLADDPELHAYLQVSLRPPGPCCRVPFQHCDPMCCPESTAS
jgi:hypothetical protein